MTPFRKPELPAVKPAVHAGPSGESGFVTLERRRSGAGHATPKRSEGGPVPRSPKGVGGFSLIFMSIFITAMAMLFVSVLPGKEDGDTNAKTISDIDKLNTVEEHMRSFMAFNGRRPCPADGQYPDTSKYFGQEAAIAGTCQGGTPAAPLGPDTGTNNIIAGVIPTRSLGLDTSYAYDSYGRRFTYVVDKRATSTATCDALEGITGTNFTPTGTGGITIDDANGNLVSNVMYAYIQHGQSGYGAWPGDGSPTTLSAANSAARRVNSGSTDKFMQTDAWVDIAASPPGVSGFTPTPSATLYKNSLITPMTTGGKLDTGFDDLVWYRDDLKNTCCLGPKCIPKGFRVDGQASGGNNSQQLAAYATGDINGDGIPDIIVGEGPGLGYNNKIYVIFGTSTSGANSSTPWPIPPTGLDPTTVNGTNGFIIQGRTGGDYFWSFAIIADINGDGYGDIITPGQGTASYIIFGGPGGCQASTALCNLSSTTPWLPSGNTLNAGNLSGYKGALNGYAGNSGNGISGVRINTGTNGTGVFGASGSGFQASGLEVGNIDDSGYPALIEVGSECCAAGRPTNDSGFVVYGRPTVCPGSTGCSGANGPNGPNDTWANTASLGITTLDGSTGTSLNPGFQFYSSHTNLLYLGNSGLSTITGDFDDDGYKDIVIRNGHDTVAGDNGVSSPNANGAVYILYGRSRADWQSSFTTYNSNPNVVDLEAELTNNTGTHCSGGLVAPAHYNNCATEMYYGATTGFYGGSVHVVDINGDGVPDLLTSMPYSAMTVIYGNTTANRWPELYNVYNIAASSGFYYSISGTPNWLTNMYNNPGAQAYDVNGDGKLDLILGWGDAYPTVRSVSRTNAGAALVIYQPSGGWGSISNPIKYTNFKWDGTDSFQIYGAKAGGYCGFSGAGDVRPSDKNAPELLFSCPKNGENSYGSVYGLYKNKGWPSSIDLNNLN